MSINPLTSITPSLSLNSPILRRVKLTTYGEMKWSPSIASKTNCPVDSTYFPFDIQKCNITLTPWGYTDSEVNISVTNMSLDTSLFREHEMWSLISYQSNTESKDNQSFAFFELTLQRKPKYFLLMFYLPESLKIVWLGKLLFRRRQSLS
jgi:hypothetical protein